MSRTRITAFTLLATLLAILVGIAAFAHEGENAKPVTVKGEIVDLACYLDHGATGMKHQQCALACLKGGQPMGLLTADGKVYLLLADHQNAKPFDEAKGMAALQVEVTGPPAQRAGVNGITVESVKKA